MAGQSARANKFNPLLLLLGLVVAVALLLLTQEALAEQVGGLIGGLWVSTVEAVVSLFAAVFGG